MAAKKSLLVFFIIFLTVLVDFLLKLFFQNKKFVVLPNLLEISYVKNYGLVYGVFSKNVIFTIIVPIILLIVFFYFFIYKQKKQRVFIASSFVIAGILGNLISRIKDGFVTDFIYVPFLQPIFPNFNIADLSAFIGIFVLVYFIIKEK